jgi:hypothetical protein
MKLYPISLYKTDPAVASSVIVTATVSENRVSCLLRSLQPHYCNLYGVETAPLCSLNCPAFFTNDIYQQSYLCRLCFPFISSLIIIMVE